MPHMTNEEAYQVLGLNSGATESQVKSAYRKLALKTHPDKNPGNEEAHKKFLLVSEAYKRITEPESFQDEEDGDFSFDEEEMAMAFMQQFAEMFGMAGMFG